MILLIAKRDRRMNSTGPPCRYVTSKQGHRPQHSGHSQKSSNVQRTDSDNNPERNRVSAIAPSVTRRGPATRSAARSS